MSHSDHTLTNPTVAEQRSTDTQHPPSPAVAQPTRVRIPDRIALRLGLALITWSRRSSTPETWERRASRIEQELAREAREREALHRALTQAPLRRPAQPSARPDRAMSLLASRGRGLKRWARPASPPPCRAPGR